MKFWGLLMWFLEGRVQCEFLSAGGCGCRAVCHPVLLPGDSSQQGRGRCSLPKNQNTSHCCSSDSTDSTSNNSSPFFCSREMLGAGCSPQHAHHLPVRNEESQDKPALSTLAAGLAAGPGEAEEAQRCPGQAGGGNSPWLLQAGWELEVHPHRGARSILNQCCPSPYRQFLLPFQKSNIPKILRLETLW